MLTTTDVNGPSATHIYSLVPGVGDTNNIRFTVSNDTLYSDTMFDYVTKRSYSIRLRTQLVNNLYFEKYFRINITIGADTIKNILISDSLIYENSPASTVIGQLKTVSTDTLHKYTYALDNSLPSDNASFFLTPTGLLSSTQTFDYETKSSYKIYVKSNNLGGVSYVRQMTILIRDTLDTPTDIILSDSIVNDNAPVHHFIGKFSTVDVNGPTAIHMYAFTGGSGSTDNASFTISNDSIYTLSKINYAVKNMYSVRVRSTLVNGLYYEKKFAIIITNVDTITDILISNNRIYENSAPTTVIGQLSTVSTDTLNKYTYAFDNSVTSDNASFTLTSKGLLSAAQTFDYETKASYTISVTTTNTVGTFFTRQLTIIIRDTLDAPTDIKLSDSLVVDNSPGHTFIGTFSTIDVNGSTAIHNYSLVSVFGSVDDTSFTISNDSLYTKPRFDYDRQNTYHIRAHSALINGLYTEKMFTIIVTNFGEGPHAHNDSIAIKEDAKPKYLLTVALSDSDKYSPYTYKLLTTGVPFSMSADSGKLNLTGALDFHQHSRYELWYRVTDDMHLHDSAMVVVTVLPIEEAILPVNNYVSPNGDGKNDFFAIVSPEVYKEYELTIFNSSGVIVYKTTGYNNEWNGHDVEAGVYYYTLLGNKQYKGSLVLVK